MSGVKICVFDMVCSKAGIDVCSVGLKDEKSEDKNDSAIAIVVTKDGQT